MEDLYIGYIQRGEERGRLQGAVIACHDFGESIADTVAYLMKVFNITQDAAEDAIKEYWNS